MKHLRPFSLFESLDAETIIDAKGDIADTIQQLIGFDESYINISYSELEKLIENDFDAFLELTKYYASIDKAISDRSITHSKQIVSSIGNYFSDQIPTILLDLLKNDNQKKFLDLITALDEYHRSPSSRSKLKFADVKKYLDSEQQIQLLKSNRVTYNSIELVKELTPLTISFDDIIENKDNLNAYLRGLWNNTPEKLFYDPKILNRLAKEDVNVLVAFLGAINLLFGVIRLDSHRGLLSTVNNHLDATYNRRKMHGSNYKIKSIGPYIYRPLYTLFKAGQAEDAIRVAEKGKAYKQHFQIPFGAKDIQTVIPKEVINDLLLANLINLSKADKERILNDKDQYAIWIEAPSYDKLINNFQMQNVTSEQIKRNGNIKFSGDEYFTAYSYGVIRRSGATGATVDQHKSADNPKGAEELFQEFRKYLSRKAFQRAKKDYSVRVKQYLKHDPIKSRSATADEWEKWFAGLAEHFNFYGKNGKSVVRYVGGPIIKEL